MIKKIAVGITSFLVEEKIIVDGNREVYQFWTEQILINLWIDIRTGTTI